MSGMTKVYDLLLCAIKCELHNIEFLQRAELMF